jgi:hypothetical protein
VRFTQLKWKTLHKYIKLGSGAKHRCDFNSNKHVWHKILNENSHLPHSETDQHSTTIVRYFRTYGTLARDHYVTNLKCPRNFRRLCVGGRKQEWIPSVSANVTVVTYGAYKSWPYHVCQGRSRKQVFVDCLTLDDGLCRELLTQWQTVIPQTTWIFIIHLIYRHSTGLLLKLDVNQRRSYGWASGVAAMGRGAQGVAKWIC